MGNFSKNTKGRAWIGTVQIANMEKSGLSEENYKNPEQLADFLIKTWEKSGANRTAGVAVCISGKNQVYHAHIALYGNTTTLKNVSTILFDSHIEPQLGGKEKLKSYLQKEPPYDEKGEQVLYTKGLENIQNNPGKRSDIEEIEAMLEQGLSPDEIMEGHFSYRKYEKMIKSAYLSKRIRETPLIKETHNEWHVGESGSGKTYYYYQLCKEHSAEKIYMATDFENGGFDFYIEQGAPPILFMDEFKGNLKYSQLLIILDKYSRSQIHSRYMNVYNLWTTCIITSIFPPDEIYSFMVEDDKKSRDKITQLLRRLDLVVYHYKENGEYKTYTIPASEYKTYEDLKMRATGNADGFVSVEGAEEIPFDE